MGQLVIVCIAIILMALVVVGGSGYIRSDTGVRMSTTENVVTGFGVVEAAFRSYKVANRGVTPTPDDAAAEVGTWIGELSPYLPEGHLPKVDGFEWSYARVAGDKMICLIATGAGEAALEGLSKAADRIGVDLDSCDGAEASIGKPVS